MSKKVKVRMNNLMQSKIDLNYFVPSRQKEAICGQKLSFDVLDGGAVVGGYHRMMST